MSCGCVWPFQESFADVMDQGAVVIAETYPGEVYRWLGFQLAGRKSDIANLVAAAPKLLGWLRTRGVRASPALVAEIEAGFAGRASDDRFDAVVGAMGLLDVALGVRADGAPMDDPVSSAGRGGFSGSWREHIRFSSPSPRPSPCAGRGGWR